ncbi:MFS general substrate transporter [Macrolepiota fuliginosa MF-IS2]|uniref:MFS general substrate transporter n=1 Tax=Macrolepiota fuliginosa MF-IS2 TaxID=1400762 RepID=A0A9P6C7C3_9AGAR|nr:MFS general substrate transporter [Macrolepiota fuliginosa MF-IS2]
MAPGRKVNATRPWGLHWRSAYWFATYVVGLGVAVDVVVYSIIIPVVPFQLEHLGYSNVSALSGWLLFAYSGGLLLSTIPVAMWSEHYNARKYPMLVGLLALIGSQIMFMEAPTYAVMCVARIIQGVSSSVIWVVGLAFLCDVVPPEIIGRQLGIAMGGLSFGLVVAPPLGGVLYSHLGFRGPFVFALIAAFVDLVSRLIMIEQKEATKWGVHPTIRSSSAGGTLEEAFDPAPGDTKSENLSEPQARANEEGKTDPSLHRPLGTSEDPAVGSKRAVEKPLPLFQVMLRLLKSSRALVALVISFIYGFVYSSQEPALPLHLQSLWGLSSQRVGVLFLALSVPMLFSSPITGWFVDALGAEWVATASMLLAIPWWGVVTVQGSLALFGVSFALQSFFTSGAISPLFAELAAVSRNIHGVGYAHVYAAFNVAYGIGTTVGPIAGGQMYDHIQNGWFAICVLGAALLFVSVLLAIPYTGDKPLLVRARDVLRRRVST